MTTHASKDLPLLEVNQMTGDICEPQTSRSSIFIPQSRFTRGEEVLWRSITRTNRNFDQYERPKVYIIMSRLYDLDEAMWIYEIHAGASEKKWLAAEFELISVRHYLIEEQIRKSGEPG